MQTRMHDAGLDYCSSQIKLCEYIQIGISKCKQMEGITDAIIDRYVHTQISRRDSNLPLQFWIMRNAG